MTTTKITTDFSQIKNAVAQRFTTMQQHKLYRTSVNKDLLWDTYLNSFPAGSNPIFRKRAEHDCSCCKHFIRTIGNVVAIINGEIVSIWDVNDIGIIDIHGTAQGPYGQVCEAMSKLVKDHPIENVFLHYEKTVGTDKNYDQNASSTVLTWQHFYTTLDTKFREEKKHIPTLLGDYRSHYDVAMRGLVELQMDAIDTVLELISQNSLYRGEEHKDVLLAFKKIKQVFDVILKKEYKRATFVWENIDNGALRIRNTVIGTLLQDLSADVDLEQAVKSFEQKVAPINYKRPSSLITKSMIEQAKRTIEELGLTSALQRRHATLDDISINNVLFADRSLRKRLGGENVFDELMKIGSPVKKKLDKIEEIPIDKFISDVLSRVESVEVLFERKHQGNLVSLIAPVDPTAGKLFKWDNRFSWSYNGEFADSIKERVKKAGGNVTGDLCNRLAWYNYDDLDLHMIEPNGYEIYYGTKHETSSYGGRLDVDMNAGGGQTRDAVENIFYTNRGKMKYGTYTLVVHQFSKRESQDVGFEVEIDWMGDIHNFVYTKPLRPGETVIVAMLHYTPLGMKVESMLPEQKASKQVWNIGTNQFHKAQAIMLSPNHWHNAGHLGNRHWFFMLDQCKNDGTARGFFNEFLMEELSKHRKVFEIVGSKTKVEESDNQLSGLGFSSTKNDFLVCRVKGSFTRELKIVF